MEILLKLVDKARKNVLVGCDGISSFQVVCVPLKPDPGVGESLAGAMQRKEASVSGNSLVSIGGVINTPDAIYKEDTRQRIQIFASLNVVILPRCIPNVLL